MTSIWMSADTSLGDKLAGFENSIVRGIQLFNFKQWELAKAALTSYQKMALCSVRFLRCIWRQWDGTETLCTTSNIKSNKGSIGVKFVQMNGINAWMLAFELEWKEQNEKKKSMEWKSQFNINRIFLYYSPNLIWERAQCTFFFSLPTADLLLCANLLNTMYNSKWNTLSFQWWVILETVNFCERVRDD